MPQKAAVRRRRGMTFYELLTSLMLLAGVIAGMGQCMVTVASAVRETKRYERAVELANIVLERAVVTQIDQLNTDLGVWDDRKIVGIQYAVQIQIADPPPPADPPSPVRQVTAKVSWRTLAGDPREVTLHAWRESGS